MRGSGGIVVCPECGEMNLSERFKRSGCSACSCKRPRLPDVLIRLYEEQQEATPTQSLALAVIHRALKDYRPDSEDDSRPFLLGLGEYRMQRNLIAEMAGLDPDQLDDLRGVSVASVAQAVGKGPRVEWGVWRKQVKYSGSERDRRRSPWRGDHGGCVRLLGAPQPSTSQISIARHTAGKNRTGGDRRASGAMAPAGRGTG